MKPWFRTNEKRLIAERKDLSKSFPDLNIIHWKGPLKEEIIIEGPYTFPILETKDTVTYFIRIVLPDNYPCSPPKMFYIDKYLGKTNLDRHIEQYGKACLCTPTDIRRFFKENDLISVFIKTLVHPHTVGQYLFDLNGRWLLPDRSHGYIGIIETYQEQFGIKSATDIVNFLIVIVQGLEKNCYFTCPCKSGKALRKCHWKKCQEIEALISKENLIYDAQSILELIS